MSVEFLNAFAELKAENNQLKAKLDLQEQIYEAMGKRIAELSAELVELKAKLDAQLEFACKDKERIIRQLEVERDRVQYLRAELESMKRNYKESEERQSAYMKEAWKLNQEIDRLQQYRHVP